MRLYIYTSFSLSGIGFIRPRAYILREREREGRFIGGPGCSEIAPAAAAAAERSCRGLRLRARRREYRGRQRKRSAADALLYEKGRGSGESARLRHTGYNFDLSASSDLCHFRELT